MTYEQREPLALHGLHRGALLAGQLQCLSLPATAPVFGGAAMSKLVRFRCVFCGREHDTVEECNGCEESH